MPIAPQSIKDLINAVFPDAAVELNDYAGDQDHYELTIISTQFEGLSAVKRHQLVYQALGAMVGTNLHALSLRTFTPNESHS